MDSKIDPKTEFQRCIVHLIRNTMKYVAYNDRKELAADLKLIYTASSENEAYKNLQDVFDKLKVDQKITIL